MKAFILCLIVGFAVSSIGQHSGSKICKRDPQAIYREGRSCNNPCSSTRPCKSLKSKCLCDGVCGMVCIPDGLICDHPDATDHGKIYPMGKKRYNFEETISYTCEKGYELIGPEKRKCQGDESWSGIDSFCTPEKVRCTRPSFTVEKGFADIPQKEQEFYLHNIVEYKCLNGYLASRNSVTRTKCNILKTNETEWSPAIKLTCNPKRCPPPITIEDGDYEGSDFYFNQEIIYNCNPGYILNGVESHFCTSDGTWSGYPPKCEVVQCDHPAVPKHGNARFENIEYGSTVWYSCEEGFHLIGPNHVVCSAEGTWSSDAPICKLVNCGKPGVPDRGNITGISKTTFNGRVDYECNPGTSSSGMMSAICTLDLEGNPKWSTLPPVCLVIQCDHPANPKHGNARFESNEYGSIVRYSCDEGFQLTGPNHATCSATGTWSADAPICKLIQCDYPANPKHGNARFESNEYGSTVRYSCDEGFQLTGPNHATCSVTGTWSADAPICKLIQCDHPANPKHGNARFESTEYGSAVRYSCDEGFQLTGPNHATCSATGTWSADAPICKLIQCDHPANPKHGNARLESNEYGSTVRYSCDKGFQLTGPNHATCSAKGTWSADAPFCRLIQCNHPANLKHGNARYESKDYGSTVRYSCDEGFQLIGPNLAICSAKGTWSGDVPICKVIQCDHPANPKHGNARFESNEYGSSVSYSCDEGFQLVGPNHATCSAKGAWSADAPICKPVQCDHPATPKHGHAILESNEHGSKVWYSCEKGFLLLGPNHAICSSNGTWSGDAPICNQMLRKQIHPPGNRYITPEEPTTETTPVQEISTKVSIECIFQPIVNVFAVHEGRKLLTSTYLPHGAWIHYRCSNVYFYAFVGHNSAKCVQGEWSGVKPSCHNLLPNTVNSPPPLYMDLLARRQLVITENGVIVFPPKEKFIRIFCYSQGSPVINVNGSYLLHDPFNVRHFRRDKSAYFYLQTVLLNIQNETEVRIGCGHADPPNYHPSLNERIISLKISEVCTVHDLKWQSKYNQMVAASSKREVYVEGDIIELNCTPNSPMKHLIPTFKKCLRNGSWEDGPVTSCDRKNGIS